MSLANCFRSVNRSTPNIVNAAQKIISSSFGNPQSSKSDKLRQDMKPKRDPGPSPRIIACKDDKAEGMLLYTVYGSFGSYLMVVALLQRSLWLILSSEKLIHESTLLNIL